MLKFSTIAKRMERFLINTKLNNKNAKKVERDEDDRLATFQKVCDEIAAESSYINKSKILENFLEKGSDNKGFKGNILLWIQLLLPSTSQRVYNLQNKQMLKLFSRLFACNQQEMQLDLEQEGDVSETLRKFFESSSKLKPQTKSTLYLQEVDEFLIDLEKKTKEEEQTDALRQLCKQATPLDLKMIIRIIKQDLRINAGARHILDAFGPLAYPAYQSSRDLEAVVRQFSKIDENKEKVVDIPKTIKASPARPRGKSSQIQVMTPISPMLANACKSVEEAFKKSPSGLYSEIKYDGERVQIHKRGGQFKFFSRNLKLVMDHKIKRFKEFIPKAFPGAGDMILDSEIILVDTVTGELLPFGTLGAQKKKEYARAEVCLFVFDCILFNGEDLTSISFSERRKILEENITPVKSYVQLSESRFLKTKQELAIMTAKVLKANLEGVVLKSPNSSYQPGKRGWLKVKKDYLFEGKMADTADLVVLGGSFGSGKKGGILSIFLMGCYDPKDHLWKTVTKVHSGLDDVTQEELHEKLMKLMVRTDPSKLPKWFLCRNALIPDYIAKDPFEMPVWEITGAEFTKSESHTAAGISIRFPRITRLRDDKSAKEANDLEYLQRLYDASKSNINLDLLLKDCKADDNDLENIGEKIEFDSKICTDGTPKKRSVAEIKEEENDKEEGTSIKRIKRDNSKNTLEEYLRGKINNENKREEKPTPQKVPEESKPQQTPLKDKDNNRKGFKREKQLKLNFTRVSSGSTMSNNSSPNSSGIDRSDRNDSDSNCSIINKSDTQNTSRDKDKMDIDDNQAQGDDDQQKEKDIFKGFVAYFDEEVKNSEYKELFSSFGGVVTDESLQATIALYKTTQPKINLDDCRKKFQPTCRHLSIDWINESVAEKKCAEFPIHAVMLD